MDRLHHRLQYIPVNTYSDPKAFQMCRTCLTNALRPLPQSSLGAIHRKTTMTDSGGLQIVTLGMSEEKIILVGPLYENRINDPDFLTIGILTNCKEYGRLKSSIAFCVDIPIDPEESCYSYYYKINEAISARNQMFEIAKSVCPETTLGIVLHPRNPLEIQEHFCLVATPECSLYAYPSRSKPSDALGNAYVLSFLHSLGVQHIHFLGSSAITIIALLAAAVNYDLFASCSFDSLTWCQPAVRQGYRYLSPETLQSLPRKRPLHPNQDLLWVLRDHEEFLSLFQARFNPPKFMLVKEWLGLVNIQAVEFYKNKLLDKFNKNESIEQIFGENSRYDPLVEAIQLLNSASFLGHNFVEKEYDEILRQGLSHSSART